MGIAGQKKWTFSRVLLMTFVILITVVVMVPFVWTIFLSFKTDNSIINTPLALPETWNLDNYKRALETLNIFSMYLNTLIVVVCTEAIALIITFMSSFAISRMVFRNNKLRNGLYYYFLLGIGIPVYVLLFPIYRINMQINAIDNYWGLILPYVALAIAFNSLLLVGFLNDFPSEIEESAIIDGCNLPKLCLSITVPIMKPILATVIIFNVITYWNEFPFAVTYISSPKMYTISLAASMFKGAYSRDYSGMVAAAVMIMIPQLVFYALFQKNIIAGMTEGAVKA